MLNVMDKYQEQFMNSLLKIGTLCIILYVVKKVQTKILITIEKPHELKTFT